MSGRNPEDVTPCLIPWFGISQKNNMYRYLMLPAASRYNKSDWINTFSQTCLFYKLFCHQTMLDEIVKDEQSRVCLCVLLEIIWVHVPCGDDLFFYKSRLLRCDCSYCDYSKFEIILLLCMVCMVLKTPVEIENLLCQLSRKCSVKRISVHGTLYCTSTYSKPL